MNRCVGVRASHEVELERIRVVQIPEVVNELLPALQVKVSPYWSTRRVEGNDHWRSLRKLGKLDADNVRRQTSGAVTLAAVTEMIEKHGRVRSVNLSAVDAGGSAGAIDHAGVT